MLAVTAAVVDSEADTLLIAAKSQVNVPADARAMLAVCILYAMAFTEDTVVVLALSPADNLMLAVIAN